MLPNAVDRRKVGLAAQILGQASIASGPGQQVSEDVGESQLIDAPKPDLDIGDTCSAVATPPYRPDQQQSVAMRPLAHQLGHCSHDRAPDRVQHRRPWPRGRWKAADVATQWEPRCLKLEAARISMLLATGRHRSVPLKRARQRTEVSRPQTTDPTDTNQPLPRRSGRSRQAARSPPQPFHRTSLAG
jgi:hypothetical protein